MISRCTACACIVAGEALRGTGEAPYVCAATGLAANANATAMIKQRGRIGF